MYISRGSLTFSFPIYILIIYRFGLSVEVKTSNIILNKSGESWYPCFIPDFIGNALYLSWITAMLPMGLPYIVRCSYNFFLNYILMAYYIYCSVYVEPILHSWDETSMSWSVVLLSSQIKLAGILRNFSSMFIREICL